MKASELSLPLVAAFLINAEISRAAELNTSAPVRSCCAAKEITGFFPAYTNKSLCQVESNWTADGGKPIKLGELAGKRHARLMFFPKCTVACPILLNGVKPSRTCGRGRCHDRNNWWPICCSFTPAVRLPHAELLRTNVLN
jgi:hypothetical protein